MASVSLWDTAEVPWKSQGPWAFGEPSSTRNSQDACLPALPAAFVSIVSVSWLGAVDLSGAEALGPLPNAVVVQPPAPMPRKSQTVSGQAPSFRLLPWPGRERLPAGTRAWAWEGCSGCAGLSSAPGQPHVHTRCGAALLPPSAHGCLLLEAPCP